MVSVSYTLRVVVESTGLFSLNNTTKCNVEFRPLSGFQPCLHNHTALLKTVNYLSADTLGLKRNSSDGGHDLPPYTPSIAFECDLPPCKMIVPGDLINLRMAFVIPTELRHLFALIWVTSIRIKLKTTTTAIVGSHSRTHTANFDCYTVMGSIPLHLPNDDSRISIPPELWGSHIYPHPLASFQLKGARREHAVEVTVDFSWVSPNNIRVSATLLPFGVQN